MATDWQIWQLVDSAFPTGAFAHSWGLEAAWQQGEVSDHDGLREFLRASLLHVAYGSVPLANAAHAAPARLPDLDALADAFLTTTAANRASRIQGRTLVAGAARVWPGAAMDEVRRSTDTLACHLAPVTGAVFRALDVPLASTQRALMFGCARGVLSAAVRLGIAGSYEAQQLQADCAPWADRLLERSAAFDAHDLAQTAPLVDILQGTHDRLYSRLFQS